MFVHQEMVMGWAQGMLTRAWVGADIGDLDLRAGFEEQDGTARIVRDRVPKLLRCDPLREAVIEWPEVWRALEDQLAGASYAIRDGAVTVHTQANVGAIELDDLGRRLAAVRAKVSIPAAVLVPRALRIAEHDTDPLRRAAALRGLARVAPAQALSIARACRSSNATERGAAWLVRAAAGEDASTWFGPQVNVHTLTLLADCKAWPTLSVLLPGWMRDPEPDLAQRAVRLAAHVDDPGPRLLALVDSPHDEVRVAVLETLLSLRLPQAEDAALEVLKTRPPPEVAFAAVRALAERGTVRAVAPLLAYADEPGVVGQRDTDARDAVSRIQSRLGPVEAGRVSVAAGGEVSIAGGVEVSLAKRRT